MSYSTICSTKILTLAIAPFLFISWVPLWICYGALYILLSPQEEDVHPSSWEHRCIHWAAHSSKRFKPLPAIILLCQSYCWIEKSTNNRVMVLIIRPGSTLKFHCFLISMNFSEQSSPYWVLKMSGFLFGLWLYDFWFYDADDFIVSHLLPLTLMPINKKLECKDHQIHSKTLIKIYKKEV